MPPLARCQHIVETLMRRWQLQGRELAATVASLHLASDKRWEVPTSVPVESPLLRPPGAAQEACDRIVGDEEDSAPFTDQQHRGSNSQDRGQGGSSCCDDAESPTDQLELPKQGAIWARAAPHRYLRMAMHLVARRQARHFAPSEHLAAPAAHVVATSVLLDQGAACRAALQMGLASSAQHLVHGEVRQINAGVERAANHLKHAAATPRKWLRWKLAALHLALALRTPRHATLPRARLAVLADTRPAERMAARQPLHICDTVAGAEADGALPTKALAPDRSGIRGRVRVGCGRQRCCGHAGGAVRRGRSKR
mmetsp:Transcript_43298/g.139143  ORF Transcript_43298/g.139143 Transcript_43298/m.139143 type:complete len:311 (+) Transcript_43298:250-1182(+)